MSDDNLQDKTPVYTFLGSSPADVYTRLADLHHKEAKQLLERAQQAQAEEREEEAKLLMHEAAFREERGKELEKTAKGQGEDPSVIEALDGQRDILHSYTPNTMTFFKEDELPPATVPEHMRPRPPDRIDRTLAKISNWWNR
jgi:hypothetical protein